MIDEAIKSQIDSMDYETMLKIWRFAPLGADLVSGETGDYFKCSMLGKKNALLHEDQVRASKSVGWERY